MGRTYQPVTQILIEGDPLRAAGAGPPRRAMPVGQGRQIPRCLLLYRIHTACWALPNRV